MQIKFSQSAKQAISCLVLSAVIGNVHAGLPVVDFGAIAQAITQVQNQVSQIQNMRQQLKAITDNGNFANLLNDPNLRNHLNKYLPKGYTDITQAIQNGDAGALQSIYEQVQRAEEQKRSSMTGAERVKMTNAMAEAQMIGMMKNLDVRSQSVQNLVNQINRTQNTAQKQDLMNALQAEQAMIQTDLGKMQVMMKLAEEQRRLANKQAGEEWRKARFRK